MQSDTDGVLCHSPGTISIISFDDNYIMERAYDVHKNSRFSVCSSPAWQ